MNRIHVKTLKARNPLVASSLFRKAGSHGRSKSGVRQQDSLALRRTLADWDRERHSP
jgi:hypothetical protein